MSLASLSVLKTATGYRLSRHIACGLRYPERIITHVETIELLADTVEMTDDLLKDPWGAWGTNLLTEEQAREIEEQQPCNN